jgi:hypothetical protein
MALKTSIFYVKFEFDFEQKCLFKVSFLTILINLSIVAYEDFTFELLMSYV